MQLQPKFNLTIERMIYGGDGLARLPAEPGSEGRGKAVFIPFVMPGESVEAHIIEENAGFARAELDGIHTRSEARVEPACPYFFSCGGCQYQHMDYPLQLQTKSEILRETLRRMGGVDLTVEIQNHAASPLAYRNRTRLHLGHRPKFAVGYYRFHSNDLLAVEACSISAPLIGLAIKLIVQIGNAGGMPAWVREIEFATNHDESALLLEFHCDARTFTAKMAETSAKTLEQLAEQISCSIPEFIGLAAFELIQRNDGQNDAPPRLAALAGDGELNYRVGPHNYRVGAGSFFQANRYLLEKMVNLVTRGRRGSRALDLYAGVGLFSLPLAGAFGEVTAVEIAASSFSDLEFNAKQVTGKLKTVRSTTQQFLRGRTRAEYVVADPPRGGLGPGTCAAIAKLEAPRICYVSCDPSTLARDLKLLLASGYRIDEAHLIDMFPQTFHIESVFHLAR